MTTPSLHPQNDLGVLGALRAPEAAHIQRVDRIERYVDFEPACDAVPADGAGAARRVAVTVASDARYTLTAEEEETEHDKEQTEEHVPGAEQPRVVFDHGRQSRGASVGSVHA